MALENTVNILSQAGMRWSSVQAHRNQNDETNDHESQKYPSTPRIPAGGVAFAVFIAGIIIGHC
jgi:hypothetical protein